MSETEPIQYHADSTEVIAFGTDVWLQTTYFAEVNLTEMMRQGALPRAYSDCEGCDGSPVAGAFAPVNDDYSIERCDACGVFESDFDAALAIAKLIGGGTTVWYYPQREPDTRPAIWSPAITGPPAPGYRWEIEFVDGVSHRGGVIYWVRPA